MSLFGAPTPPQLPEYPPMYTSTTVIPDTASVTLLADGTFVLGCPRGCTDRDRVEAIEGIKHYLSGENGGIVLPWPCTVDDQRGGSDA